MEQHWQCTTTIPAPHQTPQQKQLQPMRKGPARMQESQTPAGQCGLHINVQGKTHTTYTGSDQLARGSIHQRQAECVHKLVCSQGHAHIHAGSRAHTLRPRVLKYGLNGLQGHYLYLQLILQPCDDVLYQQAGLPTSWAFCSQAQQSHPHPWHLDPPLQQQVPPPHHPQPPPHPPRPHLARQVPGVQ